MSADSIRKELTELSLTETLNVLQAVRERLQLSGVYVYYYFSEVPFTDEPPQSPLLPFDNNDKIGSNPLDDSD